MIPRDRLFENQHRHIIDVLILHRRSHHLPHTYSASLQRLRLREGHP
ncbi:Uncharacterised protein [Streptomyces griseus]|nr:Uncharacterised protein [Streptomyces griseus]